MTNTKTIPSLSPFIRTFSRKGFNVFETVDWELRTVEIVDETGKSIFKQENVEVPKDWSQLAVKVVVSKYFYGEQGKEERETSVRQLVSRVCGVIAGWAVKDGYVTEQDGPVLYDELCYMSLHQIMAFNSPVWFNVGLWHVNNVKKSGTSHNWRYDKDTGTPVKSQFQYEFPQCSACFIQSVEDNMESIMALATHEAMLFKFGSGTGTNLSTIRSSREVLSGGGRPSGPLSFLSIYDQVANVVKSGGKTRRAAKMNILNHWHGDFEEFVVAKQVEEKKAWALIEHGYDGSLNGDAYSSVAYQNENLSVRLSDDFMVKATTSVGDPHYWTKKVTTGESLEKKNAKEMLKKIAEGAWVCGDPGVQFDDTINKWHTCPASGRINATNPCSEFIFLDDTACNLASINLMKFVDKEKVFDVEKFVSACTMVVLAQEVLVDNSSYPTAQICQNAHDFRPLGLGYCNLGAMLMYFGYPYSSEEGRGLAASVTALMTGSAYYTSALIAGIKGAFDGYAKNKHHVGKVMMSHFEALDKIEDCPPQFLHICQRAGEAWRLVLDLENQVGLRNSQVTVLAPTGTIGFMMDCDTTGIEPDLSLVKYKALVGGGNLKIVNATVPMALSRLGYRDEEVDRIVQHIAKWDTIEDVSPSDGSGVIASGLKPEHLPVFDCAIATGNCKRSIPYLAHIRMMAAVQPFLSGGISKTVNVPNSATVDDISDIYVKAWQLGLKCVAVYRDGSKKGQPLKTGKGSPIVQPVRRRMPDTRSAVTHKFSIAGHEGYLTVGFWDDDGAGELFIQMAKEGSTIGGLMDTIGTLVSIALQHGVPLDTLVEKFTHQRFEPSGFTTNPEIKTASSVIDYVFRWMQILSKSKAKVKPVEMLSKQVKETKPSAPASDAPSCHRCGHISVRNGSCHKCPNCGESLGCS